MLQTGSLGFQKYDTKGARHLAKREGVPGAGLIISSFPATIEEVTAKINKKREKFRRNALIRAVYVNYLTVHFMIQSGYFKTLLLYLVTQILTDQCNMQHVIM